MGRRPCVAVCLFLALAVAAICVDAQASRTRRHRAPGLAGRLSSVHAFRHARAARSGTRNKPEAQAAPSATVKNGAQTAGGVSTLDTTPLPNRARGDRTRDRNRAGIQRVTPTAAKTKCPKGSYLDGEACVDCTEYKPAEECGKDCRHPVECRHLTCPAGSYRSPESAECEPCPTGSYSRGGFVTECTRCPHGRSTKKEGAKSVEQCECPRGVTGPHCDECSQNMVLMEDGKCGCKPGHGGRGCTPCSPGFWSYGGSDADPFPACRSCGPHLTSPPAAVAPEYCECEAGYGADRTDVPMEERTCVLCDFGTFNPGEVASQGHAYGELSVGVAALSPMMVRKRVRGVPQILACQACSARNPQGGFTTLDMGSKFSKQCICKPGYGGFDCAPCEEGTFSLGGRDAVCHICPNNGVGFTTVPRIAATSVSSCVCRGGFGMREDGQCKRCAADYYTDGPTKEECVPCPFGTTSAPGASSLDQCREVAQLCPIGQTAPRDAVSKRECGCYAGYGSVGSGDPDAPCALCPAGTYSGGGDLEACTPCRFGYTSPAGSKTVHDCEPVDVCPAGTELPPYAVGASTQDCRCKPGYGSQNGAAPCHLCPVGTYSEGASLEECKPCPFGHTSESGATDRDACHPVAQKCPVGQIASPRAVSADDCGCIPGFGGGATPKDACTICPAGTFASGGDTQPCQPCRFGYTSPVGSASEHECYPTNACPAGTELREGLEFAASVNDCVCRSGFGSATGTGACHLCPAGTYSHGGSMEDCRPCPFGTTSAAGAPDRDHCLPSPQACPIGQWAPEGSVSKEQCVCYPGFGAGDSSSAPCTLCPAGTFAAGNALDKCMPCGFGYTSPEGSTSEHDCRPINQCPAGTAIFGEHPEYDDPAVSAAQCLCKPGFGSSTGTAPCRLCPPSTYSAGGTLEECLPCPFGYTSAPGAKGIESCVKVAMKCPAGQIAPSDAVSPDECACLPGYGGGEKPTDACRRCPPGTFAPGGTTEPCTPCGFGFTSPAGSTSKDACYATNACPVGTEVHRDLQKADSLASCVCKPGFGADPNKGFCKLCPANTYAYGGDWDECQFCPFATTSAPGAKGVEECMPASQPCPIGQLAPPGAVSPDQCACAPGFGGGDKPTDPCVVCPVGTWSPGGNTHRCIPCGFGHTSPEGAVDASDCREVDMCPAGTEYHDSIDTSFSLSDCVCKAGHGSPTGSGICKICPAGTFSAGGTMEDCKPCGFGYTSPEGAESFLDCRPVAQRCPIGQWAPEDAASAEECRCYNGFGSEGGKPSDPCTMCPAGTFSANRGTEKCIPCPAGYTSLAGSDSMLDCHKDDSCPPGTEEVVSYDGLKSCKCKAGFGSVTGTGACRLCPVGSYAEGGTMEDCKPCPFGHTSRAGANSAEECQKITQPCPVGQIAPPDAVSAQQCGCMPGYGGGEKATDACHICPPGTYSPGGTTQRCTPCGYGYTSPEGSASQDACVEANACPTGSIYQEGVVKAFSMRDCVCRPGYGQGEDSFCRICRPGTYGEGGTMDVCKSCGEGWASEEGSVSWHDCFQELALPFKSEGQAVRGAKADKATNRKPAPASVGARKPIGASIKQVPSNGTAATAQKVVRR